MLSDEFKFIFYIISFVILFFLSIHLFLKYVRIDDRRISCLEFENILRNCDKYMGSFVFLVEQCKDYMPGRYKITRVDGKCIAIQ